MKQNWKLKIMKFMHGRYGHFDALGKLLIIVALLSLLISGPFRWLAYVLIVVAYYRFFSKRIYVRANENKKYLVVQNKVTHFFKQQKEKFQQRKTHVYFRCPECKQQLRAPKGKGKIKVTCSQCHHQFIKKV
ncbi:hypothetical protein [Enterococcus saccharolyticus]|uniref:Zn-finger containing protein n=1 Tax=Enterococcus saccharolyticus subsp. saccharolyticus ATCC 43076 TaxID=1139996 RepID=S0JQ98_9ENTE|nr:hypothetical protein [Enterococcus saccharolyticus]EOT30705.1 hypothetical protein OMQ_00409 [Enterococcus saccharolyticus subsp. saccharolyticus ATCC 43076]EOT80266.1 hypothetical protein I572_00791 [Enterococcus saccharolyticus subsp. saccharolyticus ATCC 43076]OJG88894.1 hypothetical protein RV16_GL002474 [Enterococcus saccharolyticus]